MCFALAAESALDGPESEIHQDGGGRRVPALALAYEFQGLLDAGVVNTRADIGRRYKLTRARITQLMNLLTLPDEVQAYLMSLSPEEQCPYSERRLREVVSLPSEQVQLRAFQEIRQVAQQTEAEP